MRVRVGAFDTEYEAGERETGLPWLVLVHCLGGSLAIWQKQMRALAGAFNVLAYDLRGQGESANPGVEYSVSDLADDCARLMDALAIRRASIVGLSLGGMVAQLVGFTHPDRVEKLVLASTSSYFDAAAAAALRERAGRAEAGEMETLADMSMSRSFSDDFRASDPDEVRRVRDIFAQTSPTGFAMACRAVSTFDARQARHQIAAPTLVISGECDPVSTPALGREIAGAIPGSQFASIAGAAHLSCIERPDAFNRLVLDFLSAT